MKNCMLYDVFCRIDVGIHVVDSRGFTIYYNGLAEKFDGLNRQDILGKNMKSLVKQGIFSKSVALDVLEKKREISLCQKVNQKVVYVRGVPVFQENSDQISQVIVFVRDLETLQVMEKQLSALRKEHERMIRILQEENTLRGSEDLYIYRSQKMNRVLQLVDKVSKVDSSVLILGETGVGKNVIAKILHEKSGRSKGPFIKVDCSAIPETLIESELFGYTKGSFTGALKEGKIGLIRAAHQGTLFLDEIGELPLSSQVKLLTVLQERSLQPIGTAKRMPVDIRIVSATNQNLSALVSQGKFREDLYYRLKVIPITIPPLRERKIDIFPLIELFVQRLNAYYSFNKSISPSAIKILMDYSWPGNVRELENAIERILVISEKDLITEKDVFDSIHLKEGNHNENISYKERVDNFEKSLIREYASLGKNIKEISRLANINESTLRKKIKRFGLGAYFN